MRFLKPQTLDQLTIVGLFRVSSCSRDIWISIGCCTMIFGILACHVQTTPTYPAKSMGPNREKNQTFLTAVITGAWRQTLPLVVKQLSIGTA